MILGMFNVLNLKIIVWFFFSFDSLSFLGVFSKSLVCQILIASNYVSVEF
jgi:hypothetical protein